MTIDKVNPSAPIADDGNWWEGPSTMIALGLLLVLVFLVVAFRLKHRKHNNEISKPATEIQIADTSNVEMYPA